MTKLKTLKDLDQDILEEKVIIDLIKKEAIKWVKFGFHKNKEGKWIQWKFMFREFFNITEEDLK